MRRSVRRGLLGLAFAGSQLLAASPVLAATYLPRADELRREIKDFSGRVRGHAQDRLDFTKLDDRFRKILSDYRRLYPNGSTEAEDRIIELYTVLKPAFVFFKTHAHPKDIACLQTISRIDAMNSHALTDIALGVEVTRKLCNINRELTRF